MLIALYIVLGIILFLLLSAGFILFVPFKVFIRGSYIHREPSAVMDVYWIRYVAGARLRMHDMEHLRITIWFLGLPVPLKLPLQRKKKAPSNKKLPEAPVQPDFVKEEQGSEKENRFTKEKMIDLINKKDNFKEIWKKYSVYLKKIYVRYITFSIEYLDADIGLKEPSQTGMTAAIVYSILPITPLHDIRVNWNYQEVKADISLGTKITMKLYGIFCTLINVYRTYKKDVKK